MPSSLRSQNSGNLALRVTEDGRAELESNDSPSSSSGDDTIDDGCWHSSDPIRNKPCQIPKGGLQVKGERRLFEPNGQPLTGPLGFLHEGDELLEPRNPYSLLMPDDYDVEADHVPDSARKPKMTLWPTTLDNDVASMTAATHNDDKISMTTTVLDHDNSAVRQVYDDPWMNQKERGTDLAPPLQAPIVPQYPLGDGKDVDLTFSDWVIDLADDENPAINVKPTRGGPHSPSLTHGSNLLKIQTDQNATNLTSNAHSISTVDSSHVRLLESTGKTSIVKLANSSTKGENHLGHLVFDSEHCGPLQNASIQSDTALHMSAQLETRIQRQVDLNNDKSSHILWNISSATAALDNSDLDDPFFTAVSSGALNVDDFDERIRNGEFDDLIFAMYPTLENALTGHAAFDPMEGVSQSGAGTDLSHQRADAEVEEPMVSDLMDLGDANVRYEGRCIAHEDGRASPRYSDGPVSIKNGKRTTSNPLPETSACPMIEQESARGDTINQSGDNDEFITAGRNHLQQKFGKSNTWQPPAQGGSDVLSASEVVSDEVKAWLEYRVEKARRALEEAEFENEVEDGAKEETLSHIPIQNMDLSPEEPDYDPLSENLTPEQEAAEAARCLEAALSIFGQDILTDYNEFEDTFEAPSLPPHPTNREWREEYSSLMNMEEFEAEWQAFETRQVSNKDGERVFEHEISMQDVDAGERAEEGRVTMDGGIIPSSHETTNLKFQSTEALLPLDIDSNESPPKSARFSKSNILSRSCPATTDLEASSIDENLTIAVTSSSNYSSTPRSNLEITNSKFVHTEDLGSDDEVSLIQTSPHRNLTAASKTNTRHQKEAKVKRAIMEKTTKKVFDTVALRSEQQVGQGSSSQVKSPRLKRIQSIGATSPASPTKKPRLIHPAPRREAGKSKMPELEVFDDDALSTSSDSINKPSAEAHPIPLTIYDLQPGADPDMFKVSSADSLGIAQSSPMSSTFSAPPYSRGHSNIVAVDSPTPIQSPTTSTPLQTSPLGMQHHGFSPDRRTGREAPVASSSPRQANKPGEGFGFGPMNMPSSLPQSGHSVDGRHDPGVMSNRPCASQPSTPFQRDVSLVQKPRSSPGELYREMKSSTGQATAETSHSNQPNTIPASNTLPPKLPSTKRRNSYTSHKMGYERSMDSSPIKLNMPVTTPKTSNRESVTVIFNSPQLRKNGVQLLENAMKETPEGQSMKIAENFDQNSKSLSVSGHAGSNVRGFVRKHLGDVQVLASMI